MAGFLILRIVSQRNVGKGTLTSLTAVMLYLHQHFLSTSWVLLIKSLNYIHSINQTNPFFFLFSDSFGKLICFCILGINNKII